MSRPGRFFSWDEITRSSAATRLGLANEPPPTERAALVALVSAVLDPLRAVLGVPLRVTSGFRCVALNAAIGGSPTSQHTLGEAADVRAEGMASEEVVRALVRAGLPFDQAIWYAPERGGHVHVSYTTRRPNRRQTLHAPAAGGYVGWAP